MATKAPASFPPIPRDEMRLVNITLSEPDLNYLQSVLRGRSETLRRHLQKNAGKFRPSERAMIAMDADRTDALNVTIERTARHCPPAKPE